MPLLMFDMWCISSVHMLVTVITSLIRRYIDLYILSGPEQLVGQLQCELKDVHARPRVYESDDSGLGYIYRVPVHWRA